MHNSRLSPLALILIVGLSAFSSSCWFRKTQKAFTPPPPETQPQLPSEAARIDAKPPAIEGDPAATIPNSPVSIPDVPAPPAPKPPARKTTPTPPPSVATPTTPPPTQQQQPPTRLGQIYTPEEQREYNRIIDESLNRVKRLLDALARKNLSADQQVEVSRITNFQKLAEQSRDSQDLLTAKNFAQRADTLAQDLFGRIP